MKIYTLGWSLILMSMAATAQEPPITPVAVPLPEGELLRPAPARCEWKIQYTYSDTQANKLGARPPAENSPLLTTITKTDHFYHEVTVDTDSKKLERWTDGQIEVIIVPGATSPSIVALTDHDHLIVDYNKTEFPDWDWISAETYVGMIKKNFKDYMVFRQGKEKDAPLALVDLKTRLPFRIQAGHITREYSFADVSITSQNFSDVVQRIFERQAKVANKLGGYGDRP